MVEKLTQHVTGESDTDTVDGQRSIRKTQFDRCSPSGATATRTCERWHGQFGWGRFEHDICTESPREEIDPPHVEGAISGNSSSGF